MPVTTTTKKTKKKKEQTTNAYGKERKKDQTTNVDGKPKMAALIRQANSRHQMNQTKPLTPPQKRTRWPTCKHKVEKKLPRKSQQSNRLLSTTNEWTNTFTTFVAAIRAQSKNNCANDKQMESQTNHN